MRRGAIPLGCAFWWALLELGLSVEKHWLPDLEWRTGRNWVDGRAPVAGSKVVFPLEMEHAAGMPKTGNLMLSEIDLSRDGSLVLPMDGKLKLSDVKESKATVAQWSRQGPLYWADPMNWNSSSEAVPHLERIPCRLDLAVLPSADRTLSIRLPMTDVLVKAVRMKNDTGELPYWMWMRLHDSREFFQSRFSVRYSNLFSCEGCDCQDSSRELMHEVCEIQRSRCEPPACEYPLAVEGHCCYYCGARLGMRTEKSYLPIMRTLVNQALEGWKGKIFWHIRNTWEGDTEVLITERGEYSGVASIKAAQDLEAILKEKCCEVITDNAGAPLSQSSLSRVLGELFGAPFVVLLVLVALFFYFGYTSAHLLAGWREFWTSIRDGVHLEMPSMSRDFKGFARFENVSEANVKLADTSGCDVAQGMRKADTAGEPSRGGRFANPLYRSDSDVSKVTQIYDDEDEDGAQEVLNVDEPVSLAALKQKIRDDPIEEIELNVDD